jgi:hypothetical protein
VAEWIISARNAEGTSGETVTVEADSAADAIAEYRRLTPTGPQFSDVSATAAPQPNS